MSFRRVMQKGLTKLGHSLVRLPSETTTKLEAFDERATIRAKTPSRSEPRGDLERWFRQEGPLGIHKWHHYFEIYERHFAPVRRRPAPRILEIGVSRGGSLAMWKAYFGAESKIVGLDIKAKCRRFDQPEKGIHVRIGDQESSAFLAAVNEEFGPFDIIIDDGGHTTSQQIASFAHLYFTAMTPDGIYLVEDLLTNYWPSHKNHPGGLTFVELACQLVHRLHDPYLGRAEEVERFMIDRENRFEALDVSAFCAQTHSIHFYDSIIVFERAPKTIPLDEMR